MCRTLNITHIHISVQFELSLFASAFCGTIFDETAKHARVVSRLHVRSHAHSANLNTGERQNLVQVNLGRGFISRIASVCMYVRWVSFQSQVMGKNYNAGRFSGDAAAAGLNKIYRFINQMTYCLCKVCMCVSEWVRNLYVSQQIGNILMARSTRESAGSIENDTFRTLRKVCEVCAIFMRSFWKELYRTWIVIYFADFVLLFSSRTRHVSTADNAEYR